MKLIISIFTIIFKIILIRHLKLEINNSNVYTIVKVEKISKLKSLNFDLIKSKNYLNKILKLKDSLNKDVEHFNNKNGISFQITENELNKRFKKNDHSIKKIILLNEYYNFFKSLQKTYMEIIEKKIFLGNIDFNKKYEDLIIELNGLIHNTFNNIILYKKNNIRDQAEFTLIIYYQKIIYILNKINNDNNNDNQFFYDDVCIDESFVNSVVIDRKIYDNHKNYNSNNNNNKSDTNNDFINNNLIKLEKEVRHIKKQIIIDFYFSNKDIFKKYLKLKNNIFDIMIWKEIIASSYKIEKKIHKKIDNLLIKQDKLIN